MNLREHIDIVVAAKPQIASDEVTGEPGTGFEKAGDKGPFECGNCSYQKSGVCTNKVMRKYSKQPRNGDGFPKVDEHDCCEYVHRMGGK